jgi:hypothetical protein
MEWLDNYLIVELLSAPTPVKLKMRKALGISRTNLKLRPKKLMKPSIGLNCIMHQFTIPILLILFSKRWKALLKLFQKS